MVLWCCGVPPLSLFPSFSLLPLFSLSLCNPPLFLLTLHRFHFSAVLLLVALSHSLSLTSSLSTLPRNSIVRKGFKDVIDLRVDNGIRDITLMDFIEQAVNFVVGVRSACAFYFECIVELEVEQPSS